MILPVGRLTLAADDRPGDPCRRDRPVQVEILEAKCVGCNLCSLVCPVDSCITMRRIDSFGDSVLPYKQFAENPTAYPHVKSNRHDK